MSDQRSAGSILDGLGVTLDLADTDLLTDVMVVGKIADLTDGGTNIVIGLSDGMDWVNQLGLLAAANVVLQSRLRTQDDD